MMSILTSAMLITLPLVGEEASFNPLRLRSGLSLKAPRETYYNDNTEQSVTVLTGGYSTPSGWVEEDPGRY
ncbi:MAG: hypothetical protein CM15mP106_1180 [Candidatus Neomarinimicrobiota bacterium]|nr:MAG: hypothetical protein CM15mP106_1180 [Candidatus Neomarinimicrobiota bacterium]